MVENDINETSISQQRSSDNTGTKSLRIAMVTTFYPPYHFGGDAQLVRQLTHSIASRGHQVTVIHDRDAHHMLSGGSEPAPLDEPNGVEVIGLRSRIASLSCLATQQLGRPLVHGRKIRQILDRGFDVIHFHNISLVGGPGVLAYGDAVKLYTTHEHWLVCESHILWRHNREICTGRQCLRCVLRHRRPPQLWRATGLLKRNARHVDAFLAPSKFCANKHREYGFDQEMQVLPNFLPDIESLPAEPHAGNAPPRPFFLFVGRLEKIKGLQEVIPHFVGDGSSDLWIAGSGTYEAELRDVANGSSRVRFLGHQTQEQLRGIYQRARAVLVPSICYEVFPMVVLEAFREGAPVIARDLGPLPEIVNESQGGMLFKTSAELKDILARLEHDDDFCAQLGNAGRKAFETKWSEPIIMQRYFDLIERFLELRR